MNYELTKLIKSLEKAEIRHFKIYSNRFGKNDKEHKKLVQLFDWIHTEKQDVYKGEISKRLALSKNAYYRLKNRLIEEIEASLLQQYRQKDEVAKIYSNLILAQLFMDKSEFARAKKYLEIGEKLAKSAEQFDLLQTIYDKFIQWSHHIHDINPALYVKKKQENRNNYALAEQAGDLLASVSYDLRRSNFSGKENELIQVLEDLIKRLQKTVENNDSSLLKFKAHICIRDALLHKKDFKALAQYMIDSYKKFEEENVFNKNFEEQRLVMISWIVNALIKTQDFEQGLIYTQIQYEILSENKALYDKYIWYYYQSRVAFFTFLNRLDEAIDLLDSVKSFKDFNSTHPYYTYWHINLISLFYYQEDLEQALSFLSNIITDTTFKKLSIHWQITISIVEIILRIDNSDLEYAANKYQSFRRSFRKHLLKDNYKREKQFTNLLKLFIRVPNPTKQKKLLQEIDIFKNTYPNYEPASNDIIDYGIWLESKLQHKPYYEVMLQTTT